MVALSAWVAALCACSPSADRSPVDPGTDTTGTGGVPRATLTVTLAFAPEDSAVVRLLGGASAAASGTPVRLHRQGAADSVVATLGSTGSTSVSGLLEGTYDVSVLRVLTASERQQLGTVAPDADAYVAAATIDVHAPTSSTAVPVAFGRRGSLVISELYFATPYDATTGTYYGNGHFVEVYNNADTTVYLDGLTVATAYGAALDYPNFPCAMYASLTTDTLGLWADFMWRIPGSGRTYPLAPGATAVLAADAVDHRAYNADSPDLSRAQFEFRGSTDVDNPSVPDMISFGTRTFTLGSGFVLYNLQKVVVLAQPLDLAQLTQTPNPGDPSLSFARIPAAAILDVVTDRDVVDGTYAVCPGPLAPKFERQTMTGIKRTSLVSIQRRSLYQTAGRSVLQRTGATAVDFVAASPTPGTIP